MKKVVVGTWRGMAGDLASDESCILDALYDLSSPCVFVEYEGRAAVARGGRVDVRVSGEDPGGSALNADEESRDSSGGTGGDGSTGGGTGGSHLELPVTAVLPPLLPDMLGDAGFLDDLSVDFPLVAGAMYHGITSRAMVEAMSRAGMLAFFGAGGLSLQAVEEAVSGLKDSLGSSPFGCNLLSNPFDPALEAATVDVFLKHGIRMISASAYTSLSLPIVRYRLHGIHRRDDGTIVTPNRVIGKVSRVEVASKFFAPPPDDMISRLVEEGHIDREQAELAGCVPVAQDLTAEADSGGHTDKQPFITMVPTMLALRDAMQSRYGYDVPLRVGVGGGIGTPAAAAAAFAMGAAYLVTGSVNQSCVEAGTSKAVKEMLCKVGQADVTMAPAADMFEMGVKVQVLKRGTMFPMRAERLWGLYRRCNGLGDLSPAERDELEKKYFRASIDEIWAQTRAYFDERDPAQSARAGRDEKHRMALVFRWYLGQASNWATRGEPSRRIDYQVQCGPSMGAFNEWVKGSFLERADARRVVPVSLNLLAGAAVMTRLGQLGRCGVKLPARVERIVPLEPEKLAGILEKDVQGLC